MRKASRITGFVILALILGFFGLNLLFTDLGPGETIVSRLTITALFHLVSGLVIGFFNSGIWMLAGVAGWGGALMIASGLIYGPPIEIPLVFAVSLVPVFLGGFVGALFRKLSKRRGKHRIKH